MSDSNDLRPLVEHIHASPTQAVVVVSGAGAQAVAWLLGVPGASRTVLEVTIPYGRRSMVEFLGREPAGYASAETAAEMAEAAYRRALALREAEAPVIGLACTATIATDRHKRGDHRCAVAACDGAGSAVYELILAKGKRDRAGEEDVVSRLLLHALAEACGVDSEPALGLLEGEHLDVRRMEMRQPASP